MNKICAKREREREREIKRGQAFSTELDGVGWNESFFAVLKHISCTIKSGDNMGESTSNCATGAVSWIQGSFKYNLYFLISYSLISIYLSIYLSFHLGIFLVDIVAKASFLAYDLRFPNSLFQIHPSSPDRVNGNHQ